MKLDLTTLTIFIIIVGSALWYSIKHIVRQNGYETHYFWGHFTDIINFHRLINKEQSLTRKRKYIILLIAFYFVLVLIITGFILSAYLHD